MGSLQGLLHRLLVVAAAASLALIGLVSSHMPPASAATDTGQLEQVFVWELNRARRAPYEFAAEQSVDLPPGMASRPALAFDPTLTASARSRSLDMSDNGLHPQNPHRSPSTGAFANAVARQFGFPLPAAYPNDANNIESLAIGSPEILPILSHLLASPSHRTHVLGQSWFESHRYIGVGFVSNGSFWTIHTSQGPEAALLTGMVYADLDADGRPDPGEGLPGVAISAGTGTTTTNAGGGWTIATGAGLHEITVTGPGLAETISFRAVASEFPTWIDVVAGSGATMYDYGICDGRALTILRSRVDDPNRGPSGGDVVWVGAGDGVAVDDLADVTCGATGISFAVRPSDHQPPAAGPVSESEGMPGGDDRRAYPGAPLSRPVQSEHGGAGTAASPARCSATVAHASFRFPQACWFVV